MSIHHITCDCVFQMKYDVFCDLVVAIGLSLFLRNDKALMPSIAALKGDSAVSKHYTTMLNSI